jgi:hypothetical protein
MNRHVLCAAVLSSMWAAGVAAQRSAPSPAPQPSATSVAKPLPVEISGCLGNDPGSPVRGAGATTTAMAQPRYSLGQLNFGSSGAAFDEWARTRPSSTRGTGAGVAAPTRPKDLILSTTTVDLSKYVGQNIQVTGAIGLPPTAAPSVVPSNATATAGTAGTTATKAGDTAEIGAVTTLAQPQMISPGFTVTSIKVLSKDCRPR